MTSITATKVEFDGTSFSVDATLIAEGFGITPTFLRTLMRQAKITSRCERGTDRDAGRHRLTFFHGARRLRLVIDDAGRIVDRRLDKVHMTR